jgi:protein phosphatase
LSLRNGDIEALVNNAIKVKVDEFLRLIEEVSRLLAEEKGNVGNLRINGRLASLTPKGEAVVVGDLHGDLESLVHILESSRFVEKAHEKENSILVFLGDYGDRGSHSPEVYYIVLKLKELFPEKVVLMRGNHEGPEDILAYPHDLPDQLHGKFGEEGLNAYAKLRELFNHLYNAVLVEDRCILLHGGVPSMASRLEDIAYAHEKHPTESHLEEILWSDPEEGVRGTYPSPRGAGKLFGEDVTEKFLNMLGVKVLIRGHEPSGEGFKINHGGRILTLFSRRGPPYYNDHGAYLHLDLSKPIENAMQLEKFVKTF